MSDQPLAIIHRGGARRVLAIAAVVALGVAVWSLMMTPGISPVGRTFLLFLGLLMFWGGWLIYRSTSADILLTEAGIIDSRGEVLVAMENIDSVDSGLFALKPTNGFRVRLKTRMPRRWAPGAWWRIGKSLGVGGAVPAGETKAMGDILVMTLAQRAAGKSPIE